MQNKLKKTKGSAESFNKNWCESKETNYNHFIRGRVKNQIQFAFRQHWDFLREVVKIPKTGSSLEVGCGRGSISSYLAENGYNVTLLDISEKVIDTAKKTFKANNHFSKADFYVGDAEALPFEDKKFDIVISIGLLEHFKDARKVISEQIRILKKNGLFIAYVVPEKWSIQNIFKPLNNFLKNNKQLFLEQNIIKNKSKVYRSKYDSGYYLDILKNESIKNVKVKGVFPFPSISYSADFPFTLMPDSIERVLVDIYTNIAAAKRNKAMHPWVCDELLGQGFYIWGKKK